MRENSFRSCSQSWETSRFNWKPSHKKEKRHTHPHNVAHTCVSGIHFGSSNNDCPLREKIGAPLREKTGKGGRRGLRGHKCGIQSILGLDSSSFSNWGVNSLKFGKLHPHSPHNLPWFDLWDQRERDNMRFAFHSRARSTEYGREKSRQFEQKGKKEVTYNCKSFTQACFGHKSQSTTQNTSTTCPNARQNQVRLTHPKWKNQFWNH